MGNYLDLVVSLITPFVDWYWYKVYEEQRSKLKPDEVILASLFLGYMVIRLWDRAVKPSHKAWKNHIRNHGLGSSVNCLELVWTTRSASQASKILPDILNHYNALVSAWGAESAKKVCVVKIHVTDPDQTACAVLRDEIKSSPGVELHIGRLDIGRWIEDHTLKMIDSHKRSYSLLAFCGSPKLAQTIHQEKISNDMITAITGYNRHQMEFVSESYGGPSKKKDTGDALVTPEDEVVIPEDESSSRPSVSLNRFSIVNYERGSFMFDSSSNHTESGGKFSPVNRPSVLTVSGAAREKLRLELEPTIAE